MEDEFQIEEILDNIPEEDAVNVYRDYYDEFATVGMEEVVKFQGWYIDMINAHTAEVEYLRAKNKRLKKKNRKLEDRLYWLMARLRDIAFPGDL